MSKASDYDGRGYDPPYATEADLQKSIDDLSAAIDRKNALVDELVAAGEKLERWYRASNKSPLDFIQAMDAILAAIEKAKRGVGT